MTEQVWLTCTMPEPMLRVLRLPANRREQPGLSRRRERLGNAGRDREEKPKGDENDYCRRTAHGSGGSAERSPYLRRPQYRRRRQHQPSGRFHHHREGFGWVAVPHTLRGVKELFV